MKTRRWFQIHLSTAIVLMFAAGGVLWLNSIKWIASPEANWHPMVVKDPGRPPGFHHWHYGFPHEFWYQMSYQVFIGADGIQLDLLPPRDAFDEWGAAINVAVALTLLLGLWQILEWRIWRRDSGRLCAVQSS